MTRWLGAVIAALFLIGAGYVVFLNPDPVVVHVTPRRSYTPPLAAALLTAFAAGGCLVGLAAVVRAGRRGWHGWRARRRARHEARRAALTDRARALVWAGDYSRARAELLRDERGVPDDAGRIALLAETHLQEGDPAAARSLLDQGLARVGLDPRLLDLLAEAAERSGDLRAAGEALERARLGQPQSPRLARRLRDLYTADGRWNDALRLQGEIMLGIRGAAALAGEEGTLRGLRYQAAFAETDGRRVARLLLRLAREEPSFLPAWVSAGDHLAHAGRRVSARRVWERALRHQPAAVLLERLERLHASRGRPERTTRLYRRTVRRHPEAQAVLLLFARHLIVTGALDQASEALAGLPEPLASHAVTHALWGELHRRRGNDKLAAESFARAFGSDGGFLASFRCTSCQRPADTWDGYCPGCRRWGTLSAAAEWAANGAAR